MTDTPMFNDIDMLGNRINHSVKPTISDAVSVLGREVAAAYSPAGVDFWRVKKNGAG